MRAMSMAVNNQHLEDQRLAGINEELEWKRRIPLGCRFCPTDEEIFEYLKKRVRGVPICPELIYNTDVYWCKPSDLPVLDKESKYSYYFTSRDRKHRNGKRPSRSTKDNIGYWRMTGKSNPLKESDGSPLGTKNTLVYTLNAKDEYGKSLKTDWIMHEYVLDEIRYPTNDVVLCRIYDRKSKQAGKEREQRPSESQERLCTESSVAAHDQTSLIKWMQSPITVLDVGEPSCSGQWNTPQPYEPSKKSRHLVYSSRESNLLTHPIGNHVFPDGNSVQQMPCESLNGGFGNNLVFSNNGHGQQPENNLSGEYFNFQTQPWNNLVCSDGHEQQQNNLSEEHPNFQTGNAGRNQWPTMVTSMDELLAPSTSSMAAFHKHQFK